MKFLPNILFILMIFCVGGYAQAVKAPVCPTLSVEGPDRTPKLNEVVDFKAKIGGDISSLPITYHWSISSSEIIEGQGTDQIKVKFPGDGKGLTATVEIKGFPTGCPSGASETAIWESPTRSILLAEYGQISVTEENVELGRAAESLNDDPLATLTVLIYRTKKQSAGDAKKRKASIAKRLVESFGVEADRITFLFGEDDAVRTEIFLVPAGASQPELLVEKQSCPAITLTGPGSSVRAGEEMVFAVMAAGTPVAGLRYEWAISVEKEFSGQGTPIIKISTDQLQGQNITVAVKLHGLPEGCKNTASETGGVEFGDPSMIDELVKLSVVEERKRLDAAVLQMENAGASATLTFIFYFDKSTSSGQQELKIERVRKYLAQTHKLSEKNVSLVNGGVSDVTRTVIYLVING